LFFLSIDIARAFFPPLLVVVLNYYMPGPIAGPHTTSYDAGDVPPVFAAYAPLRFPLFAPFLASTFRAHNCPFFPHCKCCLSGVTTPLSRLWVPPIVAFPPYRVNFLWVQSVPPLDGSSTVSAVSLDFFPNPGATFFPSDESPFFPSFFTFHPPGIFFLLCFMGLPWYFATSVTTHVFVLLQYPETSFSPPPPGWSHQRERSSFFFFLCNPSGPFFSASLFLVHRLTFY